MTRALGLALAHGSQTWDELLAKGPPEDIQMPSAILEEVRAYGLARTTVR